MNKGSVLVPILVALVLFVGGFILWNSGGLISKHPNRFLWGTDRWFGWTFDEEVGAVLEEFGRSFIGQLAPSAQENFAYKNAEELLGN